MIKLKDFNLEMNDTFVLENVDFNFGKETYIIIGSLFKRKSLLLDSLAKAFVERNQGVKYAFEKSIVYLPKSDILFNKLSVKQNIDFYSNFFGIKASFKNSLIEHFELTSILDRSIYSLTSDLKQIVKIVCAFLNNKASVYILDSPFDNLSKSQIYMVKEYLKTIRNNSTIIISKQNIFGLEDFSPRIINIKDKKLVFEELNV